MPSLHYYCTLNDFITEITQLNVPCGDLLSEMLLCYQVKAKSVKRNLKLRSVDH